MKSVILHVGLHKTGTSSIQAALDGYDDGHTIFAQFQDSNHSILFQTLFEDGNLLDHWRRLGLSDEEHKQLVSDWFHSLEGQLKREHRRIIFSGENIALMEAAALSRVKDYFTKRNYQITIIVFIRDPLKWTVSMLQEFVKHGYTHHLRHFPLKAGLRKRLDNLIEVFEYGNVLVRQYEDAERAAVDIVEQFTGLLQIQRREASNPVRLNQSVGETTFKVLADFYSSGIVHNVGATLERVRWKFNACLERALGDVGEKRIRTENFYKFVDTEDYEALNELADRPYDVSRFSHDSSTSGAFESYLKDFDETAVSRSLRSALDGFDLGQPCGASILELTTLLFYGVMREDAREPLFHGLSAAKQQLESAQRELESTRQQLESAQRQLEAVSSSRWLKTGQRVSRIRDSFRRAYVLKPLE